MLNAQRNHWTKENLRTLRLRLGWSKSDLAYHLQARLTDVEAWEDGLLVIEESTVAVLELLKHQAEASSDEILSRPVAEQQCAEKALSQIEFSRVKAEIE